ncbi:hypothetical protein MJO29_004898 [Puccinia striiformis f. sp. tritici]|uniref:Phosphatidylglycerol/phosphatidylinositol transfer protein n=1 Tax=Puccinia striiformis f. sp. tritici PST-78 TaxID=1165861 RepID=A0A0L0VMY1_9BASI|nr:hypothetical protein Pst134EA_009036 [Puccinia striiformis f. sp. tritici]KAH9468494.1 hypothetical protein Pst134EA_009036 [Puccinia striiformis f. sp. tritici]KAI7959830.1 hypothetical protein MJO29_004898 [Puccinia striiformis f. sp. tritici]KAI9622146.1 hypothetical protein KEM48_007460 [Puccinia striiformis f. sp. tritici PST-130]KNF00557.1 hypothetical protein PSTG_06250 [Puccinia striiformis f. sp. tritici PST-78]
MSDFPLNKLVAILSFFLVVNVVIQSSSSVVQGLRWKSNGSLYLQSNSIVNPSNQFTKNINHDTDNPSTQAESVFQDCGHDSDPVRITSFEIDPNPPQLGQNLTVRVSGIIYRVIEDGAYMDVFIKVGLIATTRKRFDICEELSKAKVNLQCPMKPGQFDIVYETTLPKQIPPAKFTLVARAFTIDDSDMACANLLADFSTKIP